MTHVLIMDSEKERVNDTGTDDGVCVVCCS